MSAVVQLKSISGPAEQSGTPTPADLVALARSRATPDRERLLLGIAALCEAAPPSDAPASALLNEVFLTLASQAERDIRKLLAQTLAQAAWAPPALVQMLVADEIEIARPLIAASPLLQDADLLRILVEATIEHQIEVARRPNLGGRVADAIIDGGDPAVMTALACNHTAEVSESALRRLVEQSQRVAALRAPLVRHPRLTTRMAEDLYTWVGQALRQGIAERFSIDEGALQEAIHHATREAHGGSQTEAPSTPSLSADESERRLIGKLSASSQLRPGYLIRAIREGRLGLFEVGLATLGGFPVSQVKAAVRADSPELLCLACAAVGMDQAVFRPLIDEIRKLSGGFPGGGDPLTTRVPRVSEAAAREFRFLMDGRAV